MTKPRTQLKHKKAFEDKKKIIYKGSSFDKRKILVNLAYELKKVISSENTTYQKVLKHFEDLKQKQKYISYKKHLGGLAHHNNLGPSKRPLKGYGYVIQFLRSRKELIKNILAKKSKIEVLVLTTGRMREKPSRIPRMSGSRTTTKCKLALRVS